MKVSETPTKQQARDSRTMICREAILRHWKKEFESRVLDGIDPGETKEYNLGYAYYQVPEAVALAGDDLLRELVEGGWEEVQCMILDNGYKEREKSFWDSFRFLWSSPPSPVRLSQKMWVSVRRPKQELNQ